MLRKLIIIDIENISFEEDIIDPCLYYNIARSVEDEIEFLGWRTVFVPVWDTLEEDTNDSIYSLYD